MPFHCKVKRWENSHWLGGALLLVLFSAHGNVCARRIAQGSLDDLDGAGHHARASKVPDYSSHRSLPHTPPSTQDGNPRHPQEPHKHQVHLRRVPRRVIEVPVHRKTPHEAEIEMLDFILHHVEDGHQHAQREHEPDPISTHYNVDESGAISEVVIEDVPAHHRHPPTHTGKQFEHKKYHDLEYEHGENERVEYKSIHEGQQHAIREHKPHSISTQYSVDEHGTIREAAVEENRRPHHRQQTIQKAEVIEQEEYHIEVYDDIENEGFEDEDDEEDEDEHFWAVSEGLEGFHSSEGENAETAERDDVGDMLWNDHMNEGHAQDEVDLEKLERESDKDSPKKSHWVLLLVLVGVAITFSIVMSKVLPTQIPTTKPINRMRMKRKQSTLPHPYDYFEDRSGPPKSPVRSPMLRPVWSRRQAGLEDADHWNAFNDTMA